MPKIIALTISFILIFSEPVYAGHFQLSQKKVLPDGAVEYSASGSLERPNDAYLGDNRPILYWDNWKGLEPYKERLRQAAENKEENIVSSILGRIAYNGAFPEENMELARFLATLSPMQQILELEAELLKGSMYDRQVEEKREIFAQAQEVVKRMPSIVSSNDNEISFDNDGSSMSHFDNSIVANLHDIFIKIKLDRRSTPEVATRDDLLSFLALLEFKGVTIKGREFVQ